MTSGVSGRPNTARKAVCEVPYYVGILHLSDAKRPAQAAQVQQGQRNRQGLHGHQAVLSPRCIGLLSGRQQPERQGHGRREGCRYATQRQAVGPHYQKIEQYRQPHQHIEAHGGGQGGPEREIGPLNDQELYPDDGQQQ